MSGRGRTCHGAVVEGGCIWSPAGEDDVADSGVEEGERCCEGGGHEGQEGEEGGGMHLGLEKALARI